MGSSVAEGVLGLGAVALSILALVGILPGIFTSVACIALGVALVLESGAVAGRLYSLLAEPGEGKVETAGLGIGASIESLGGIAVIVLGILSLLGFNGATFLPVSAIVLGGSIMFGSGAIASLNSAIISRWGENLAMQRVTSQMLSTSADIKLIIGLGGVTLGILALLGFNPGILTLVAFLSIGASIFLDASTISGRMSSFFRR
ncbi:MAG: hypothetical protein ACYC5N_06010 [Endomicrobiales bacterium]